MKKIRVFLADDHKLIRDAIRIHLEGLEDIEIVGEAAGGREVLDQMATTPTDVLLLDINMEGMDGLDCAAALRADYPEVKVMVLTMHDSSLYIKQMVAHGVRGYLLKSADGSEIVSAIRQVAEGKTCYDPAVVDVIMQSYSDGERRQPEPEVAKLTPRELEIMDLIIKEYSNQEIAEELYISTRTVDAHKRNLLEKTNSKNLVGLIKYAFNHNLAAVE